MLPDPVSSPGPLTYESGALPIALCGPADFYVSKIMHCELGIFHANRTTKCLRNQGRTKGEG